MNHSDIDALAQGLVPVIQRYVGESMAPVLRRLEAVESRQPERGEPGPRGSDGKDADPVVMLNMIEEAVSKLPLAEKGEPGERGADGRDGKDAEPELVAATIKAEVETAIAALPVPQDGKSVTVDDVRPLVEEAVSHAVSAIPVPRDGVGLAGALIDRSGVLVLTLTDGSTRELGGIVGKDGTPGADGQNGADGRDGVDGKNGSDGFGFEDMTEELADEGRTLVRRYTRGDVVKEFRHSIPTMLYRGVFKEGQPYARGDTVTWAGSLWHCNENTADKPNEAAKSWTLCAKRGRDGKDGRLLPPLPDKAKI